MLKEIKTEVVHCDICQEARSFSVCDRCGKDVCRICCTRFSTDPFPIMAIIVFCKPCQLAMQDDEPDLLKALQDVVKIRDDHQQYLNVLAVESKEKCRIAQEFLERYKAKKSANI